MQSNLTILGIVGSLRKESFNKALLHAFQDRAPEGVELEIADISQVPLYNYDIQAVGFPESVQLLKKQIAAADGVLIATPEYSRSIPGVLKNVLDWTSRPMNDQPWPKKYTAVVGATDGTVGTAVAQSHLKQIMLTLGSRVLGQPEFFLRGIKSKMDETGKIIDAETLAHIDKFWAAFIDEIQG